MTCDTTILDIVTETNQKLKTPTRTSPRLEIQNRKKADRNNPFHVDFVEREYTPPKKKRRLSVTEKEYNRRKKLHDDYHQKNTGLYFEFESDDEEDYTTKE